MSPAVAKHVIESALNKAAVGLSNVDNTADSQKPVSTLQDAAIKGRVPKGDRYVNVKDYLDANRVEGTTDDRAAFEAARLTGRPVYAPAGTYYFSRSADWGNNTILIGDGKQKTIFKLLNTATADANLIVNASLTGTAQMYFADFTLDGNCQRQGGTLTGAGGSRSSNMTFRNVQYFYVDRVESINPILHSFDVTRGALDYPYGGDGVLATLRSSYGYFNQVSGTNFGDDGFTTHSSDEIHVSNSFFYDPRLRDNNNGIEFDGDSRRCTSTNNMTLGCYAGIEIKGHGSESAAQEITINGHRDYGSVRSYNFRHIGLHSGADPISVSARHITATNLFSFGPNNDKGFQDEATPRALAISAFHGVNIQGFTAIGRGGYGESDVAISIQYRAKHISVTGISISNWVGAFADVSVTSGDTVTLAGHIENSAQRALYVGSTVTSVNLMGLSATAPTNGSALHGIDAYSETSARAVEDSAGVNLQGYVNYIRANGVNYSSWERFKRRIRDIPAGITRLIDLDPAFDYYGSTAAMSAITDGPGLGGANFVEHSRMAGDAYVQECTRNTTGATIQGRSWRTCYTSLTAGPWNRESINDLVPISGVLAAGASPPVGAAVGSVWLVRS